LHRLRKMFLSDSMDQAHGDSLATAVNFAAGGFVIIRNGDDVLPLVACQRGSFLSEVGDETPQLIVSSILRGLKPNPDFPPDTSYAFIQELVTYQDSLIISPIIDVKWHQEAIHITMKITRCMGVNGIMI